MDILPYDYDSLSMSQASELQRSLTDRLDLNARQGPLRIIAGADISLNRFGKEVFAGIVLFRFEDMQPVGYSLAKGYTHFPYVPGYLAFREIPSLLKAWEQIPVKPDVVMVDGNGIIHPRKMGIASHFSLLTGVPSLGCAKRKLTGEYTDPSDEKGAASPLTFKGEILGYALRTKPRVKPVFISPGSGMSLQDSLSIAMQCVRRHRLPEPTRITHDYVNLFRKNQTKEGYTEITQ